MGGREHLVLPHPPPHRLTKEVATCAPRAGACGTIIAQEALKQGWPSRAESRSRGSRLGDSAEIRDSRLGDSAKIRGSRLGDSAKMSAKMTRPYSGRRDSAFCATRDSAAQPTLPVRAGDAVTARVRPDAVALAASPRPAAVGRGAAPFSSRSRRGQSRRRGVSTRDATDRGHAAARDLVGAIVTGHAYRRGGGTGGRGSGDGTRRGVNRRTVFSDPPSWNALRSGPGVGAAGDGRAAAADSPPLSDRGSAQGLGGFSRIGAGCEGGAVDDPTARSRAPRRWPTATRFVGQYRAPLSPPHLPPKKSNARGILSGSLPCLARFSGLS